MIDGLIAQLHALSAGKHSILIMFCGTDIELFSDDEQDEKKRLGKWSVGYGTNETGVPTYEACEETLQSALDSVIKQVKEGGHGG